MPGTVGATKLNFLHAGAGFNRLAPFAFKRLFRPPRIETSWRRKTEIGAVVVSETDLFDAPVAPVVPKKPF